MMPVIRYTVGNLIFNLKRITERFHVKVRNRFGKDIDQLRKASRKKKEIAGVRTNRSASGT